MRRWTSVRVTDEMMDLVEAIVCEEIDAASTVRLRKLDSCAIKVVCVFSIF